MTYFIARIMGALPLAIGANAQAAQQIGGRPPAEVTTELCHISTMFTQLQAIKTDPTCIAGCAGGDCPPDWYPGEFDSCSAECGATFEPFWDQCGNMLTEAHMGGMDTMGVFYDHCLESLYPPGSCGTFCNAHTFECYVNEVHESCCDEQGTNCPLDSDVPLTCPVGCALVFPEFNEICHDHITEHPELNPQEFDGFEEECLSQDALALVQYALELQAQGCTIDLVGASASSGSDDPCASGPCLNGGFCSDAEGTYECACQSMWMGTQCQMTNPFGDVTGGRRALQDTFLSQWLGSGARSCAWDEVDDYANDVDSVCCGPDGSMCANGEPPSSCNQGCAISMHQFTTDCAGTLDVIMPIGNDRRNQIDAFASTCLASLDPEFFLHAIMAATGPDGGLCVPGLNSDSSSSGNAMHEVAITVGIHAGTFAFDITWQMDEGPTFGNFADNSVDYAEICLPEGEHTFKYFDSYGDGWTGDGYWELLQGDTLLEGGPIDGAVTGYGGEETFTLGSDGTIDVAEETTVGVRIVTTIYGGEVTWDIDGGTEFGPYPNDNDQTTNVEVPVGEHTLNYFDSYGDGWSGGYWELLDADGSHMAGGETDGLVTGTGGEYSFCAGTCEGFEASDSVTITVHIHTVWWANEITWNIDDGEEFGVEPQFVDNNEYYEVLTIPEGEHVINYFYSYGDGWHGGYWEILAGDVSTAADAASAETLAGGPVAGLVTGAGGDTAFTLVSNDDGSTGGSVGDSANVVVHIHTVIYGNEITWNIDGGTAFGPFDNNGDYNEDMTLSVGSHSINAFDSYGDGWHGGYWEVINDCGDVIAGGATAGAISGCGGEFPVVISDTEVQCTS